MILGALWAAESILGKLSLDKGFSSFTFPFAINFGSAIFAILFYVMESLRGRKAVVRKSDVVNLISIGITLTFIPYLVIYMSLRYLRPYETSLITSMAPIFCVFLNVKLLKVKILFKSLVSAVFGLLGVFFLLFQGKDMLYMRGVNVWYVIMLIVPFSYAISGYFLRFAVSSGVPSVQVVLVANSISAAFFFILAKGDVDIFLGKSEWIFILGVVINILAMILMYAIVRMVSPFFLSFSNYSTVLFSFVFSVHFLGENVSMREIIPMLLISLGAFVAERRGDEVYNR